MGCLTTTITRIGEGLTVKVKTATEQLSLKLTNVADALRITAHNSAQSLSVGIRDTEHLRVACSIVCSAEEFYAYLRVSPAEVQWITDDVGVFFDVESNVQWIITAE